MADVATRPMTFEEFAALNAEGRYELVNGELEELVSPRPRHGWTAGRVNSQLDPYLESQEPDAYWGVELDIPTIPYFGRRPDFAYYSAAHAATRLDLERDEVLGPPTLVVEVLSPDDEERATVVKRGEYAKAGIEHYRILAPRRRTALLLGPEGDRYEVRGDFSGDDTLTTDLFPELSIPLSRLFR